LILKVEAYKTPESTLWPITKQINEIVKKFPEVKLLYSADIKDMKQSMKDLWTAFIVGIFLMFAVLVLNFGNYRQPLIVFSIIPLLFIWAWWLLIIFHIPFGFAAQLGMFGLIWVGVNDAILLIDRYHSLVWKSNIITDNPNKITEYKFAKQTIAKGNNIICDNDKDYLW